MTTTPETLILGLSAPACTLVARELLRRDCCDPEHPLLVVVPTKDAVRLLREQLAVCAAHGGSNGAFIAPAIVSAGQLGSATAENAAIPALQQAALFHVLQREGARLKRLAPRTEGWGSSDWLAKAGQMLHLYANLVREGVDPAGASPAAQELAAAEPLWKEIFRLYSLYLDELHRHGLTAPEESAGLSALPGTTRVILACVPSLTPQAQHILERSGLPVEVWLHADAAQDDVPHAFDAWGRPNDYWLREPQQDVLGLAERGWERHFLICGDVERMAEETARAAAHSGGEPVSVAVCDATMESAVAEAFARHGVPTVRPRGIPFTASGWNRLLLELTRMAELLEQTETPATDAQHLPASSLVALLHNPVLTAGLGIAQPERVAALADELMMRNLPATSGMMRQHAKPMLADALDKLTPWLSSLASAPALLAALRGLAANQWVESADPSLAESLELAERFTQQVDENCRRLQDSAWLKGLSCLNTLQLLTAGFSPVPPLHPEGALSLRGWLELSYAPEECLVLAGLHDGIIPERWPMSPYLTRAVRDKLRIGQDDTKAARDAYLLASLYRCRRGKGKVTALFPLFNTKRDPLFPSSTFFRLAPQQHLARLVAHFFGSQQACLAATQATYDRAGWHYPYLTLPPHIKGAAELAELPLAELGLPNPMEGKPCSPSSLAQFFACPLRFWMGKLNGLSDEQVSPGARDIESKHIGTALHLALRHFAERYPSEAAFCDAFPAAAAAGREERAALVESSLREAYARACEEEHGKAELLPRRLQYEAICHRLSAYAAFHVARWEEGWEVACDASGKAMLEYPVDWELDGHPLHFIIDRIDRRPLAGGGYEYRVIDYKSGSVKSCYVKHLTPLAEAFDSEEDIPELELPHEDLPVVEKQRAKDREPLVCRWSELQLPLYTAWALEHFGGAPVSSAYIAIRPDEDGTSLLCWDDEAYPPFYKGEPDAADESSLYGSAMAWIRFGLAAIAEGRCLISAEMMGWGAPAFDLFEEMLHGERAERIFLRFTHN